MILAFWLASVSRCDTPHSAEPQREPRAGDSVELRGTLGDDVDCRVLKADSGRTYGLTNRLRNYVNGAKVCIHGTVSDGAQCMASPIIEVQSVRPWSSCP